MKNKITKYRLMILLYLCIYSTITAQEKIVFSLNGYKYGEIQWQRSIDGNTWDNIPEATQATLEVNDATPVFYRAKVTDGTCLPWYSSAFVTTFDDISMIKVEGGTFTMGAASGDTEAYDNESPGHQITLNTYYISKYEITNIQFASFLNKKKIGGDGTFLTDDFGTQTLAYPYTYGVEFADGKWRPRPGFEIHPVVNVTWYGAFEYCKWAGGRLPSEAEWEFAARGGIKSKNYLYSGSNAINGVAWHNANATNQTHPVGKKQENELGIFDMSGNVWEWCNDWYGEYNSKDQINLEGSPIGSYKIFRGGSVFTFKNLSRNTLRYYGNPLHSYNSLGFRLVKTAL